MQVKSIPSEFVDKSIGAPQLVPQGTMTVNMLRTIYDPSGTRLQAKTSQVVDYEFGVWLLGNQYASLVQGQWPVDSAAVLMNASQTNSILGGDSVSGVTNIAALAPWYAAFADAPNAPVLIQCASDSITYGLWSDNAGTATDTAAAPNSYPYQLARLMNAQLGVPNTFSINGTDDRNTYSGSTATSTFGLSSKARNMVSGQSVTITLPACTAFDIIYYESNGTVVNGNTTPVTGSATYNVDGAGAVAIAYAATVDTYKKVSVTGLANTAHTVVIAGTAAQAFCAVQVNAHSGAGVIVGRNATVGQTVSDLLGESTNNLQSAAGQARLLLACAQGSPSLFVLLSGHNECTNQNVTTRGPQTPELWARRVQVIADLLATFGIPMLFVSAPDPNNDDSALVYKYRDYWAAARALAVPGSNVAHVAIADYWGDFDASKASGYQSDASGVHPLRKGYGSIATLLANVLARNSLYRGRLVTGA